jgi:hypothetical protein
MNVPGPGNGGLGYNHRFRAIGIGDMVGAIDSTNGPNRLGYAFFSLADFAGRANTRYMRLDGVDPLYPAGTISANHGVVTPCPIGGNHYINGGDFTTSCPVSSQPTFEGVTGGNYRAWSIFRAMRYSSYAPPSSGPSVDGLILAMQDLAHSTIHSFAPSQYCTASSSPGTCSTAVNLLPVFRVHYPIQRPTQYWPPLTNSSNGNPGCTYEGPENGGDMAGAILPVAADTSYCNITGGYFTDYIQ